MRLLASMVIRVSWKFRVRTVSCRSMPRRQCDETGQFLETHGEAGVTPEYSAWSTMKNRCSDASHVGYGERGIGVCKRWQDSFVAFLEDMGRRPSSDHSLDRKDNDGDYEPGNVRWATRKEQQRNRGCNRMLTWNGETMTVADWADRMGLKYNTLHERLRRGWSTKKALTTVANSACYAGSKRRSPATP